MSSYLLRYVYTLFLWPRPRIVATSSASIRSSVLTRGATNQVYRVGQTDFLYGSLTSKTKQKSAPAVR